MKKLVISSLLSAFIISSANQAFALSTVGEFTLDQINRRGCGMTLSKTKPGAKNRFLLFNGINDNSMEMLINGKVTRFNRIKTKGQSFYGQYPFQQFRSPDGKITVDVDVTPGKPFEEAVSIKKGTVTIRENRKNIKFSVIGDAGC